MITTGENIITGLHYKTGRPIRVRLEQGRIASVEQLAAPSGSLPESGSLPLIGPGLIDLHINGFGGVDFNQPGATEADIARFTDDMLRAGITSFLPTIYTNSAESIEACMRAISGACGANADVAGAVQGIHLEGPFISLEDGSRGAHPVRFVRPPDWELFARWQQAAGGLIKMITLAPEWPEAPAFIARCAAEGVTVSIGHTAADAEQIRRAVDAGARMSTHLGNAAHLMLPRHPNYIWEQLAEDGLQPTVIADGFHLPASVIKVIMKVKPAGVMLVSDALYVGGLPPGEYDTIFGKTVLTEAGWLYNALNPKYLAGSGKLLSAGVEFVVGQGLCSAAEAWDMASVRPAAFMNLPAGKGLEPGAPADLAVYRWSGGRIEVEQVFKQGICRFQRERSGSL